MRGSKHKATDDIRKLVEIHSTIGTPQTVIAELIGIDVKTLTKYYRPELETSRAKANAVVGGHLFNKAKGGDTAAQIFWMKTRAGWKETSQHEIGGTGPNGEISIKASMDESFAEFAKILGGAASIKSSSTDGEGEVD